MLFVDEMKYCVFLEYLKRKETKIREYNQKQKAILNAKLEEEKKSGLRSKSLFLSLKSICFLQNKHGDKNEKNSIFVKKNFFF